MKSMIGMSKGGFVRDIRDQQDWTQWGAPVTGQLADVECDDGSRVQVEPKGMQVGDRVEVTYQGFRYDARKLLF